ncbi:transposase [Mucilaginibacter oryzae]|uniref:Transposase n=1 Tax=Mucilaginibacter oryzae TaxID=468058 RepID=A0A316GZU1_9SPHI|nr:transposase [Mucilaginibacter oryzae]PWK72552.1 transposase [Mucilaginibacter oryzae]
METVRKKSYKHFIGIDVSRNTLDFAVMHGSKLLFHRVIPNDKQDITRYLEELKKVHGIKLAKAIFCMEHTGIYCNHLLHCLQKLKANIVLENPLHIKNSLGTARGKHDKADSIRIANYVYKSRDEVKLWQKRRPIIDQLARLSTLRSRLMKMKKGMATTLKEQGGFETKKVAKQNTDLCKTTLTALTEDLNKIDATISGLISGDENLNRLMTIITSVPCFGPVTALQIIIITNEYKDIRNPKKFACFAGIAPFREDSGTVLKKAKVSHIANKKIKALLHICSLTAISYPGELQDYYKRKSEVEGKHKLTVINAIRNKLILRVFSCLNQDRVFEKDYKRPFTV